MAFTPAPNIVLVELRGLLDGQRVENRIHVNVFHEPTVGDMDDIDTNISSIITTFWVPLLPPSWAMTEIFMRSLHTENDIQQTYPKSAGTFTGTNAGVALPNNVTFCVSLRTGFAGRSARGRLYWPALIETLVTGNTLDTGYVADIVEAVDGLRSNIALLSYAWVIVSYINGGAPRVGGPVYFLVDTVLAVDAVVDSMRRRLPGRGI